MKLYTVEEIDKIVKENEVRIVEYCKELERDYAEADTYEDIRVLFDLRDYELYTQIIRQGIAKELVKGIEERFIAEVYNFRTGDLGDMVFEGLEYIEDCEASQLYRLYKKGEIEEEEYFEKYDEVIQPWIDDYIKSYLEGTVGIEINYLYAVEKDNYDNWYED